MREEESAPEKEKGRIVILATGGTIAGVGKAGRIGGYRPGSLSAGELLAEIPGVEDIAEISAVQICNLNSDDITSGVWLELARTVNRMAADPAVRGFVITHGTDTMEETAYFLNLTVKTEKPVGITGSMRPSTAEAAGLGVLVVFSDRIYAARSVRKNSTSHVTAIASGQSGAIGVVRDGRVYLYEYPGKKHTLATEFSVDGLERLPRVSILYFAVDADPALLRWAAEHAEGLVIAGAGAGEFSEAWIRVIRDLTLPVVVSSRIENGMITRENLLCPNTVPADNLSPQKAAILLRLALTGGPVSRERLEEMFLRY